MKVIQVFCWDLYNGRLGGHKESVKEGKYGGSMMYSCVKMEQ
jgi:hypothetical protein